MGEVVCCCCADYALESELVGGVRVVEGFAGLPAPRMTVSRGAFDGAVIVGGEWSFSYARVGEV